jgi:hypothetical protein
MEEQKKVNINASAIRPCVCSNDFQDDRYGRSNRVCTPKNAQFKKTGIMKWACTVCGKDVK